jgi:amidase
MISLNEKQFIVAFDPTLPQAVEIEPGEQVEADVLDWCFREVNDQPETYARSSQTPRCPSTGPIAVRSAQPGDALAVEILDIRCKSPGHMVIRPGLGPLGNQVEKTQVIRIPLDEDSAVMPSGLRVPLHPMLGVIGTAPASDSIPTLWAGDHGGNLDTREIGVGSIVYLPVFAAGGLLAFGDVHAAMGDGELSGSGVEVNATVRVRVNLQREVRLPRPRVETPDEIITLATHEQISEAIRLATNDMAVWLQCRNGLNFQDALLLIGAAGSLRFSHVINKPGPTVKLIMEKSLLEGARS